MSDSVLKLIPVSPRYLPSPAAIEQAIAALRDIFPDADDVRMQLSDQVRFVDQGANWERVRCPFDKTELSTDWWRAAMNRAHQKGFDDLLVTLPCCNRTSSLNELHYEWPAGFARLSLEARNPGKDLDVAETRLLEEILGSSLRKIWAHY